MGLFGPSKTFRERTFTAPCTSAEFLQVLKGASDYEGDKPFGVLLEMEPQPHPPLAETVYLESLTHNGFVIAAGNRVRMMWRMQLTLQGNDPIQGTFGPLTSNDERWFGNVMSMNAALSDTVRRIGGRTKKWPM
ncbi:hypothetical protein [Rhodococcus sp. T7]|uniref:hypothetical protein n=1 Tax=Rhodococcus sp. T7 TaxID=627444 RepID=UPI00135A6FAF|nr:hypothetical protein [Rhodococcus sp. T7]KAF0957291.1 hypothetical protein MLGJGCBP_09121 [Rhodococcus sp. T7]KAF0965126.1 hypothetical protein MLGJGCBP_01726 [Rhodococcus sp. T7]